MAELTVQIVNKKGLHARAAAKFVKTVALYASQIKVSKLGHNGEAETSPVQGASILGLMMLGADPGSKLHIVAEGDQANEALGALKELVEGRFGEPE